MSFQIEYRKVTQDLLFALMVVSPIAHGLGGHHPGAC